MIVQTAATLHHKDFLPSRQRSSVTATAGAQVLPHCVECQATRLPHGGGCKVSVPMLPRAVGVKCQVTMLPRAVGVKCQVTMLPHFGGCKVSSSDKT